MHRSVWLGLLVGGLLPLVGAQGIADVATSPYDLAKFVETHHDFDWAPLWRALHITDERVFLQPCEQEFTGVPPCSTELITVVDPHLVILILKHESTGLEAFLRYQPVGAGRWQFFGAYAPNVKYFGPGHRVTRFGAKPFLVFLHWVWRRETSVAQRNTKKPIKKQFPGRRACMGPV